MTNQKRFLSILLSLALVLALASANAATISKDPASYEGHNFTAYQIFSGTTTQDDTTDRGIENVQWGTGIDSAAFITAIKAGFPDVAEIQALDAASTAAATAAALSGFANDSADARKLALIANSCKQGAGVAVTAGQDTTIADGYYLIVDSTADLGQEIQNLPLLQVTGTIVIKEKVEKPTLDKKVKENDTDNYTIVGDNQVGDDVEFQLTSKVPDVSAFENYTFVINDTLSAGLSFNNDVAITIGGTALDAADYTVAVDANDAHQFTITFNNAKTLFAGKTVGDPISVTYTAKLTEDAATLINKETNTASLTYTNKPGETATSTPKVVTDISFGVNVKKVDGTQYNAAQGDAKNDVASLAGAKFTLSKNADGSAPLTFTDKGNEGYVLDPNGTVTEIETTANGGFLIAGLDDATTYYLTETAAPVGYNPLPAPIEILVTATYNENGEIQSLTATANGQTIDYADPNGENPTAGDIIVQNNSGTHLPETGGIGTTIFYIGGGLVMLLAAALLIARRKTAK